MPRRAAPGDSAAIEAALSPTLRAALVELCELLDVNRHGWQKTGMAAPFQIAAVLLAATRLVQEEELGEREAVERAAARLGLSAETQRTREARWFRDSRRDVGGT